MASGFVTYPGINLIQRCRYVQTLGTTPDVALLDILPQPTPISEAGNLTISFGGVSIFLPCKVDFGSLRYNRNRQIVSLRLLDFRWAWRFTHISGHYNQRMRDGTLDTDTEKTPQELASLLFEAMGVTNYDVTQLPNTARPEKKWLFDNAPDELSDLCDLLGCRVAPGHSGQTVRIVRLGFGQTLPNNEDVVSLSYGVDSPETPETITVVASPTLYQQKIKLEAVGMDTDGQVKPIDELSYSGALSADPPEDFPNTRAVEGVVAHTLAKETVWKLYRVKNMGDGSLLVRGDGTLNNISEILPIRDVLLETQSGVGLETEPKSAYVVGAHAPRSPQGMKEQSNVSGDSFVDTPFTIDGRRGLVKFAEPVYSLVGGYSPADLRLVTSFGVQRQGEDKVRWTFTRVINPAGVGDLPIKRLDIRKLFIANYSSNSDTVPNSLTNNIDDILAEAQATLDGAENQFQRVESHEVKYRGIYPFQVDGAVRQVRWDVDMDQGYFTQASRNSETELGVARYHERRRIERMRRLTDPKPSLRRGEQFGRGED